MRFSGWKLFSFLNLLGIIAVGTGPLFARCGEAEGFRPGYERMARYGHSGTLKRFGKLVEVETL